MSTKKGENDMTVSECEKQVLRLLDEVGVSDYADRMYKLIDEAQREIACTWGFIIKAAMLEAKAGVAMPLPEDCYAIERASNDHWELEPVEVNGDWEMGIAFSEDGTHKLIYKAYPKTIGESDSAAEIQLAPEYHTALCCYVAALTQHNEYDKRAYQIFMERYNNSIAQVQHARQVTGKARVVTNGGII